VLRLNSFHQERFSNTCGLPRTVYYLHKQHIVCGLNALAAIQGP